MIRMRGNILFLMPFVLLAFTQCGFTVGPRTRGAVDSSDGVVPVDASTPTEAQTSTTTSPHEAPSPVVGQPPPPPPVFPPPPPPVFPPPPPPPPAPIAISAGYYHTCGILQGAAQCWGQGASYQLGNGSSADSNVPVQVSGLTSNVSFIAAGLAHSCAVVGGAAKCWGWNYWGQLGNNTTTSASTPVQVSGLTSGVTAIATGFYHTCAVVNGAAKCWGDNSGRLGNSSANNSSTPVQVTGLTSGVTAITIGQNHSCALVNGGVKCWGDNREGQLGNDSTASTLAPVQVTGLTSNVRAIATGSNGFHNCALVSGGVKCWGWNYGGQLGNNSTNLSLVPVPVQNLPGPVTAISAGYVSSCAVVNGQAWCWGKNVFDVRFGGGALGNGGTQDALIPTTPVKNLSGVTAITGGYFSFTCAVANTHGYCWGNNTLGALGSGNNQSTNEPVPVTNF